MTTNDRSDQISLRSIVCRPTATGARPASLLLRADPQDEEDKEWENMALVESLDELQWSAVRALALTVSKIAF